MIPARHADDLPPPPLPMYTTYDYVYDMTRHDRHALPPMRSRFHVPASHYHTYPSSTTTHLLNPATCLRNLNLDTAIPLTPAVHHQTIIDPSSIVHRPSSTSHRL